MRSEESFADRNYFADYSLLSDPYSFFEAIRAKGPVATFGDPPVVFVTGYEEAVTILTDPERFSSLNAAFGPLSILPFTPSGADITEQIQTSRDPNDPLSLLVTYDGEQHVNLRSILVKLFTPTRLKANEEFMERYCAQAVSEAVAAGGCEIRAQIAVPYEDRRF